MLRGRHHERSHVYPWGVVHPDAGRGVTAAAQYPEGAWTHRVIRARQQLDRLLHHHVPAQSERLLGSQHGDRDADRFPNRHLRADGQPARGGAMGH
ncbi:hypothetical protein D3C81_2050010 [compost metagenome]